MSPSLVTVILVKKSAKTTTPSTLLRTDLTLPRCDGEGIGSSGPALPLAFEGGLRLAVFEAEAGDFVHVLARGRLR